MKPVLAGLLLALASAAAAGDGADWLMKINNAARDLNYTGTYVYVQGSRIESMRVTHRAGDDAMRQRIYALNGAPREVIRSSEEVWCYVPDRKLGVHEYRQASKQGFPNLLPQRLERLTRYYRVEKGAEGRIADRRVQHVRVEPRDDYRYGYDLWADKETGLLLRAVLLDGGNRAIEQYMFTTVEIGGDISAAELEPVTPKSDLVWYGDARSGASASQSGGTSTASWTVSEVPDGFSLTQTIRRRTPKRTEMVEHHVYSDGLATVSVFVGPLDGESDVRIQGTNKMGAIHAFGREVNGHQVTVIGEVPSRTVDLIGMSVTPKE